jgi:hypothetical protein
LTYKNSESRGCSFAAYGSIRSNHNSKIGGDLRGSIG